jgi:hypothetical protein
VPVVVSVSNFSRAGRYGEIGGRGFRAVKPLEDRPELVPDKLAPLRIAPEFVFDELPKLPRRPAGAEKARHDVFQERMIYDLLAQFPVLLRITTSPGCV